ncbi:hypothetical protein [Streptomyces carpinensis]|uniref:hypothetical protein n=1 Tax=Streptomyces carpinensis TaxID=66369 RepID=UPI003CC58223
MARVETDFRRAGFRALTLRHEHYKRHFFTAHGYTSLPRLAVDLPPTGLFTQHDPGWKHAIKPLDPTITFTSQRGLTTVTGLLDCPPGTEPPPPAPHLTTLAGTRATSRH